MKELHKRKVKGCAEYHKPKQRQKQVEHIALPAYFMLI